MPDDDAKPEPVRGKDEPSLSGYAALAAAGLRFVNGLTSEKMMLLAILGVLAFVLIHDVGSRNEREANAARRYDEAKENDRRHCDEREDKKAREIAEREKESRAWFASQADLTQKRYDEREEKNRAVMSELTRVIARKLPDRGAGESP